MKDVWIIFAFGGKPFLVNGLGRCGQAGAKT